MSDANSKKTHRRSVSPVPEHANARAHVKVMSWLKSASREEVFGVSVKAGVYSKDGHLTRPYKTRVG